MRKYSIPITLFLLSFFSYGLSRYLINQRTCHSHCFNVLQSGLSCTLEADCPVNHPVLAVTLLFLALLFLLAALLHLALTRFRKSTRK